MCLKFWRYGYVVCPLCKLCVINIGQFLRATAYMLQRVYATAIPSVCHTRALWQNA